LKVAGAKTEEKNRRGNGGDAERNPLRMVDAYYEPNRNPTRNRPERRFEL
jgi:hypothetical protein